MPFARPARVAAAVLTLTLSTSMMATAAPGEPAENGLPDSQSTTVRLITGDKVTVRGGKLVTVQHGQGRENIQFRTHKEGDHLSVIPSDAASLVASGAVDERLFDVTTLRENGYDDASTNSIPLIASQKAGQAFSVPQGTTTTHPLPSINGSGLSVEKSASNSAWNSMTSGGASALSGGVTKLWLDGKRSANLDRSARQISAGKAWESGVTGEGATVAVLDTGVDQTHPDLKNREAGQKNFTDAPNNADIQGHGTHVAGIVAGTGAHAQGKYKGIAHGAKVLDAKVLNDQGMGQESSIIAGMQWAVEQKADVANLSLGGGDTPEIDPLEKAVNELSANSDTLFVIAAGNNGPKEESVGSPGAADAALTVGAVDRKGGLAEFSSRGPRLGDEGIKPDITAPGTGIVSALHSEGSIGEPIDGRYTALDGTSMAAPHVAGAAALLAQANPKLTGEQLKSTLTGSAEPNPELSVFEQGSGLVNIASALNQSVLGDQSNLSFGVQKWPHHDDKPVTKPLTYHNNGDNDVTLNVSATGKGPDGQQAPAGMFTVDKKRITVPAGGKAKVTVTADTRGDSADGRYSGAVVAENGKTTVNTPIAVTKEAESYDLTVNQIGPGGKPNGAATLSITDQDTLEPQPVYGEGPNRTIRLPKGKYLLSSLMLVGNPKDGQSHMLTRSLDISENTTIDVDFRETKPIKVSPPNQNAKPYTAAYGYQLNAGQESTGRGVTVPDLSRVFTAHLGPELPPEKFTADVSTGMTSPKGDYQLAWFIPGKLPTGFQRDVSQDELATVHHQFRPTKPDSQGRWSAAPVPAEGPAPDHLSFASLEQPLPGTRDVFYNTEGVQWTGMFTETGPDGKQIRELMSPPRSYEPGKEYHERFNFAPFTPAMPAGGTWGARLDNQVEVRLPLLSDGSGNAGVPVAEGNGRTTLHRGDELIGEFPQAGMGQFVLPAEPGRYRLSTELNRESELSSHISGTWTFESAPTDTVEPLPLSAVRFTPEVDDSGSAVRGKQEVPVFLQGHEGKPVPAQELSVEVSYDEGTDWNPARVVDGKIVLNHPDGAQSVSLRANATDEQGNTVEQTVIKAYTLKD